MQESVRQVSIQSPVPFADGLIKQSITYLIQEVKRR